MGNSQSNQIKNAPAQVEVSARFEENETMGESDLHATEIAALI